MPRKSKLRKCVRCEQQHATIGALTNYYLLGTRRRDASSSRSTGQQIKGSFPARGYCVDCFLRLAKKQGVRPEQLRGLRKKLKSHRHSHQ
jgi:hypothetical protein